MYKLVTAASEFSTESARSRGQQTKRWQPRRWLHVTLILAGAVLLLLARNWPFARGKVIADLEEALHAKVEVGKFHQTYFPYPGCVVEDVTVSHDGNLLNPTHITVRKLIVQGSFRGLFAKHVPVIRAEGLHVAAQGANAFADWAQNKGHSKIVVDEFVAAGSVLEFLPGADRPALKFEIPELVLRNPGTNRAKWFETTLHNPQPPGEVHARGYLGPWKKDNPAETPISGSYSFRHADLGVFHGIAGIFSSDGSFGGTLQQIEIKGKTETADFEVTRAGHKIGLATQFRARVNGKSGDVALEQVIASLGGSRVNAQGSVAATPGEKGKVASLELMLGDGRIQDFLFLFLRDEIVPMTGRFSFEGKATLPPETKPFLQRVELQGNFGVGAAHLSNPATQAHLEELSERAEAEKDDAPESVVSNLKGHVVLREGTATFSNLSFSVPGAVARLHGTYSLMTHQINLRGKVLMKANLPQATSGVESFLLKIINPLLKKNRRGGAVVPVQVTGIYPHPIYKTDPI